MESYVVTICTDDSRVVTFLLGKTSSFCPLCGSDLIVIMIIMITLPYFLHVGYTLEENPRRVIQTTDKWM